VRLARPDGRNPVTVPLVKQEVDPRTFASILKQAGVSRRQFEAVAEEVL
jgi:predicted RNA binding protein YcfA (HicA-like mRNA interferase family)